MFFLRRMYYVPFFTLPLSFRAVIVFILSLFIALVFNKKMIFWNQKKKNIGEGIRYLGLTGQKEKEGTPTMGGVIIIISTLIPTIFFSDLNNIYVIIMIVTTLWIGFLGFLDDYLKIKHNNKYGLNATCKIFGQIMLGFFIGIIMSFNKSITPISRNQFLINNKNLFLEEHRFKTNFPFFEKKFDYSYILSFCHKKWKKYAWMIFIPIVVFIVTFLSNGANLTDGLDGLTGGVSYIILSTLSLVIFISSNKFYSYYFHLIYIPHIEEVIIFSFSFLGSLIGFLWYNIYPAQIFMGDTGSLTIGGIISVLSILTRIELFLPILCGIFFLENFSVIIQVLYFKFSKKKYGIGKRIFLMTPLHHHFQKLGYHENKIVCRFFIIQMILSIIVLILLIM
ncbi:phospho-N-acetylmuramoyl-pentapeptide-transferase [Blattabacterium cuenoti]|uniref:phospho-N-acetylmuramoyl-pentapeptide- transferase n=1 Tax=Blattabacterium cuenoti TaxID=1653831 RepID=UPI00163B969F|nr:phospho-N-acetylmuramoyl-pentapeptide-transferase [Blattabacterium cuenoti]